MNRRTILPTALAVLCVLSIGVSATTLESTVQTDPDDVIDLNWDQLPIGEETAIEMKEEMGDNEAGRNPGTGPEREVEQQSQPESRQEADQQSQPGAGGQEAERTGGGVEQEVAAAKQDAGGLAPNAFPWDLLWLLAAIVLLVALAALGYRYAGRFDVGAGATGDPDSPPWPPHGSMSDVDRAWFAMVRRLDLDRPWTRTPAEFADAAVEAGMDPEAVDRVTSAFTDVHYGGSSLTSALRERARAGFRQLEDPSEGDHA